MDYKNVVFDLDGTLIDSAPGIEYSFNFAFEVIYGKKCTKSIKHFIGPPIDQVFYTLTKEKDKQIIDEFVNQFKKNYDSIGYTKSALFSEVHDVLNILKHRKKNLFMDF